MECLDHKSSLETMAESLEAVLVVNRQEDDNVTTFSIMVPSLQKLIYDARVATHKGDSEFVLNAPSLKFLKISDLSNECMVERMPQLVSANVGATYWNTDKILSALTSLNSLSLCLPSELVELEFCTFETEWDLLMSMLKLSPNLRALKLNERHGVVSEEGVYNRDEPSSVPETLMFGLQTLEWRKYRGWKREKQLATFILKHSCRLKTAIISPRSTTLERKHVMLTELALLSRGSTTCQLVFG
ncbi:unnamed protein product [Thlaspi arvense]|uniref:FBD domain-containing protein n=1 Tax=Thlaspi arvense TaxID=13288 RepID=A0AAU9SQ72_THLAR|nr:unnamed protein product [Thlaspi arvense]